MAAPATRAAAPAVEDAGSASVLSNSWGVFFWKPPGWPSQWTPSRFVLESHTFSCAEQAMMHGKAQLFDDQPTAAAILQTSDPRQHKQLGRQVRGFQQPLWDAQCEDLVFRVNLAKFTQNPPLAAALLATGEKHLVEASPLDRTWGVGVAPETAVRFRSLQEARRSWRGRNLLGEALMKVRTQLRLQQQQERLESKEISTTSLSREEDKAAENAVASE